MKTNTETGAILQHLNYKDNVVERFDQLAMFLYTIPLYERRELLITLMWQFTFHCEKEDLEKLDKIYSELNK